MTFHFPTPSGPPATLPPSLLVDIARCWHFARRDGIPPQPSLALRLDTFDCAVLAPVMDSFCLLFESALGRPLRTGRSHSLSQDERLMVALLEGPELRRDVLPCEEPRGTLLGLAIRSTRVMVALTLRQTRRVRER
ncbi:hypothetical protein [Novosphingobium sp. TCA1]|uniref:hypothetical protein n=1 Tax=Novosphingobium sp. TCA1 TaxID=2682474 RepID=UPI00130B7F10|nr:hypothetical protein [Novosphingobium sp. TCA1]GFE73850.1 hypothetical protein NTCA1_14990 [Novosphingobium sp. TCA1]